MKIIVEGRWNAAFSFNRKGRYYRDCKKYVAVNNVIDNIHRLHFKKSQICGDSSGKFPHVFPLEKSQRNPLKNITYLQSFCTGYLMSNAILPGCPDIGEQPSEQN